MAKRFLTPAQLSKIKFNQSSDAGLQPGELIWDDEHFGLMFGLSANAKMEVGQQQSIYCYNDTLSTIPAGRAVYGVGAINGRPSIAPSTSATSEQSARTFGVTSESIAAGSAGWVTSSGILGNLNTSSYTAGDELWLSSTTPGVLVTGPIGGGNHDLLIGYCLVSSATVGSIYVDFSRGVDVSGIHDIVITGLSSGDILRYNSVSGYWENEALTALGGGATVSETAPTSPSAGDIWFNSATAETFIYYDSTWVEIGEGGGSGLMEPVQGLDFDTVNPDEPAVGRMVWDDGEGTFAFGLKGGNVNLQIGQENVALCYNGTGSTIANGSVVYISGAQGQRPSLTLAQANSEATSSKVLGIATESIASGSEGFVATFGIVNGINTSSFTAGQALWLSPTVAGGLTATKPVAPNHMVFVGYAISINASSGRVFVNPQNGYEIDELHDVLITSKTDRDVLMYDSASGLWKNEPINLGTDTTGDYVASVSGTDGVSISGTGEGAAVTIANSDKGSSQNIFKNVAVSGQTTVVADSNNDTLTFANGTGITITTNATTDTLTVTNAGVTSFSAGTTGLTPNSATTGAVTLAGTLVAANGGTGQSSYAVGDLLYASTTSALSKLADVATGNALISGGVGVAPSWGKIGLTTHISGTLGVGNGGTGLSTTPTNGQLLIGNGTNYTLAALTQGTGITITNGSGSISIANAGVTSIAGTTNEVEVSASTGSVTVGLPNDVTIGNNLIVTGNLTVNGTTTTVNSTTMTVDDPIITLGGDTAPAADDNKDRGIEFRYFDTQARIGFMGYDDSTGYFTLLTAATNTSEVFSGTKGIIDANGITQAVDTNSTALATTAFVVGQAGAANPLINGTAAVGTSLRYSRQDHVHPTDTTRAADSAVVHIAGTETITGAKTFSAIPVFSAGGETVHIKAGAADHTYIGFFARTATPSTRSAYIGYPAAASTTLTIANEISGGNINIVPANILTVNSDIQLTAADPEIELNNGGPRIKVPAANTLSIHTGGGLGTTTNERMRINSSGYVGIATTNPVTSLHINTEVADDNNYTYDTNSLMVVHQTATSTSVLNDPQTVMMLARQGTGGQAYGAAATFNLSRYENSATNSRTRLDFGLAHGNFDAKNVVMSLYSNGNLNITGAFTAVTKSFDIQHPTKENMRLRYGSLEGPENGVYVRGKSSSSVIALPDYWTGLVDPYSITVQVTPIGKHKNLYVRNISNNTVTIGGARGEFEFFYFIQAERIDVDRLVVEYDI